MNISVFSGYLGDLGVYIDKICEKVKKMSMWKKWSYPTYSHGNSQKMWIILLNSQSYSHYPHKNAGFM